MTNDCLIACAQREGMERAQCEVECLVTQDSKLWHYACHIGAHKYSLKGERLIDFAIIFCLGYKAESMKHM